MQHKKAFVLIFIIILLAISSFASNAQLAAFNGSLAAGDSISSHELCATNGEDYSQVFGPIRVSETTDYSLSTLIDGNSVDGNWYFAMLSDSREFVAGEYLMYASSYGESDTLELVAETDYYLHITGCSYLEQQSYPMQFAVELKGDGDIAYNGSTQVASSGN